MLSLNNNISTISFCDKKCNNVNNNNFKEELIELIHSSYSINILSKFYTFLNAGILKNVSYNEHLLGTLGNGKPYLLFLTRIENTNCCFFIDTILKDGYSYPKIHLVKYNFHNELFEDTIFSGELIRDNKRKWFYLIDNILVYKKENLKQKNIIERYKIMNDIFNNFYTEDSSIEHCSLQIKKLFNYKDIKILINQFMPSLSYRCRGLVFYSLNTKYSNYSLLLPRSFSMNYHLVTEEEIEGKIKTEKPTLWNKKMNMCSETTGLQEEVVVINENKEIHQNNVIFKLMTTNLPDIYNLYIYEDKNNKKLVKYDYALIPNLKISKYLNNLFTNEIFEKNIECSFSNIFKKWIPVREVDNDIYSLQDIEDKVNQ